MTPAISVAGLSRRYRGQLALDNVSFDIEPGSITGLLGRNGAGKTTLLRIVAGQEFPSAGSVAVLGASPVKDDALLHRMVFVREDQRYPDSGSLPAFQVRHALRAASWFYPNWDAGLAEALLADFSLPGEKAVRRLSRGMRSALGIVIGLAARAEVTLFDEPYAGLDPAARQLFYDRLLADYTDHPRTVHLSNLIDESAGLLERVLVIDSGRIMLDAAADEIRGTATSVSGPAIAVAEFTVGRMVAMAAIYLFFFIVGVQTIGRSLPFAFALGVGRRSYCAGTALLAVSLAAIYGLALAALQVIEQDTGGWGVGLHFFRVAYILPGPWYLTWFTSFVLLALMFFNGMWFGLVYRRWNLLGLLALIASLVIVLVTGVVIAGDAHAWPAIGHFFKTLSAAGLTGLLAALAAVLLASGYVSMRRITV